MTTEPAEENGDNKEPVRFRNYLPESTKLRAYFEARQMPEATAAATSSEEDSEPKDAYAVELANLDRDDADGASLAPRDPTWDLKRDLEPKSAVLARRTQRAIVDLIRARLSAAEDAAPDT